MLTTTTIFTLSLNITINGTLLPRHTFESRDSYDTCWQYVEKYIKANKQEEDNVITDVISSTSRSHKVYEDFNH